LKQNEVVTWVTHAAVFLDRNRRAVLLGGGAIALIAIGAAGWSAWSTRGSTQASEMLAKAIAVMNAPVVPPAPADDGDEATPAVETRPAAVTPPPGTYASERERLEAALPTFLDAAAVPASGQAGVSAAYHAAAVLGELGRFDEASVHYRRVREEAGAGLYAEMARLGLAEVAARQGDYEAAIQTWTDVSAGPAGVVPVDGALMKLGESYAMAGRPAEALETFHRIVDDHPESQYATPARDEIAKLERVTPR